jgi:sigma-E factor negative regulatory protein RseA
MTEDIKQQLSALIDGELDADARRFLLRRLQRDEDLTACWERWHLARDCLQRQRVTPLKADFAGAIAAALDTEQQPARRSGRAGVLRWAGGFAVAASVALAALLAVPGPGGAPAGDEPAAVAASQPAPSQQAPSQVVPSGLRESDLRPSLQPVTHSVAATAGQPLAPALRADPRVEAYLMRHNAVLMEAGQDSFLPFIQVVSPPRQWSMLPPANEPEPAR